MASNFEPIELEEKEVTQNPLFPSQHQRARQINQVLWRVLILNFVVCVAKIIVGTLARSASMVADGFHSLSDGASNIVALTGIRLASRPPDQDHPYGHGKFETLAALAIAVMLSITGFEVLRTTWSRWQNPVVPTAGLLEFAVMFATMAVNYGVTTYERRQGKELTSDVLTSDAAHTMADLYVSGSVIASLVAVRFGFPAADLGISVVIALLIFRSAIEIGMQSSRTLCDAAILDSNEVASVVEEVDGAISCHKIRSRGHNNEVYLDLHVHVSNHLRLEDAHTLSHEIEEVLKARFKNVRETMVHLEPSDGAED